MSEALRAELLKTRSGSAMIIMFGYAITLPGLLLYGGSSIGELRPLDDHTATHAVFALAASCTIAAMFLGSYIVTREYYYKSILRSMLMHGRSRVFLSKATAAATGGALAGALGTAVWLAGSWAVLRSQGRTFTPDPHIWQSATGILLGSALAGLWGAAIGWILRGYYVTTVVVMILPLTVELPLLLNATAVEKWLPGGALAGLAQVPVDGLLPVPASALVLAAWTSAATIVAGRLLRRRETV
ncbi:hypothetical protein [Streptomyces sp. NPDC093707]|uniref:hypothetical protein n=1 Tax=Streptomyces sp. NPDC093707 TaxID=3154984 RepID=UPI00344BF16F